MRQTIEPLDLFAALSKAWSRETSSDGKNWSAENPAWGQCAVTALVVQDFFGGKLLRMNLFGSQYPKIMALISHYFNYIPMSPLGEYGEVDLTKSQFIDLIEYTQLIKWVDVKPREYLLPENPSPLQIAFKERYKLLRLKVTEILADNNPIFQDLIYQQCLSLALDSNCQKGKYGCVVIDFGEMICWTFNKQLDPLKSWCDPECIRKQIPSRTESMIGACGHAEELAIANALSQGRILNDCALYVAGFLSNGLAYIKDEPEFTCLRCAVQIYLHKVGVVYVPTKNGWAALSREECINTAKKYALQEKSLPQSPQ